MAEISQHLIHLYSAGPSAIKVTQAATLQQAIRGALDEDDFETFLQGSYRNSTAIADINDVDIVARRKATTSPLSANEWQSLFNVIAERIRASRDVTGIIQMGDKCVRLVGTALNADIVPAVAKGDFFQDPIGIWSRQEQQERENYPRTHYSNGVAKQSETSGAFKPTVRLLKRWAKQFADLDTISPSFYLECAVHAVDNSKFDAYLPLSFASVGLEICNWSSYKRIPSVAGDKDILVATEWSPENFEAFKARVFPDLERVVRAIRAPTAEEANRLWRIAFGDY